MTGTRGYNKYQYTTNPRKIEPEYRPQRRKEYIRESYKNEINNVKVKRESNSKKQKKELMRIKMKVTIYVVAIFAILFAISYRNSLINEKFEEVQGLKTSLAVLEKDNEQLNVSIENSLNLKNIEQVARDVLGMEKLNSSQTVYINLPKKDYVSPIAK